MKTYKLNIQEYSSLFKRKMNVTYGTKAETLEEAINKLFNNHMKYRKWTREQVKEAIYNG